MTAVLGLCLLTIVGPARGSQDARTSQAGERFDLTRAREVMLDLINSDRATKGLLPVAADPAATQAAQKHAEEMAVNRYLSHYNLAGKPPGQRYTEAGGKDHARENVFLTTTRYAGEADDLSRPLPLTIGPKFTRQDLEEIEASYFNETPPNDGHRRNILAAEHTHVGIGLARAAGPNGRTLANAQEFVDRYVDAEPIPRTAVTGAVIKVAGKTLDSAKVRSVSVARSPLPRPMTRDQAAAIHSYSVPAPETTYWPAPFRSPRPLRITFTGAFSVEIPLTVPGLYYVGIWVRENSRDILASLRTVEVR